MLLHLQVLEVSFCGYCYLLTNISIFIVDSVLHVQIVVCVIVVLHFSAFDMVMLDSRAC